MWNKELIESDAGGFRLFGISDDELGGIVYGGELVLLRSVYNDYLGEVVLCCAGETRFMCSLGRVERVGRSRYRYVFSDIRACIELPCPVDVGISEVWYYSPKECLVAYPRVYRRDYARESRISRWKMRWLGLVWFLVWFVIGLAVGCLFMLLAGYSLVLLGLLVFVLTMLVGYRGYKIIR